MLVRLSLTALLIAGLAQPARAQQAKGAAREAAVAAVAAAIDREIDARLAGAKIPASSACSDADFLRRASLDILGRIPTAERVRAFLADRAPDRRARLIDELLAQPEFGRYFGSVWYDLLVRQVNHRVGPEVFENWLADQFNKNRPWDAIVRDILTAEGKLDANPPAVVWFAHTEEAGKADVKGKPNDLLGVFAQKFLGQRLQCAECHNHPFTGFEQDNFWAAAALVSRVAYSDSGRTALRKDRAIPTVKNVLTGRLAIGILETNRTVAAKFPDGTPLPAGVKEPRAALAAWLATAKNPAFAPAMANRTWGHFLGRGFVNPVDDFRKDNPPSHPEALRLLAEEFAATGFDLKHLIRCVCATKAYQRSSDPLPGNAADDGLFSHAAVRPMAPGVLFHSVNVALGKDGTRRAIPVSLANKDRSPETAFSRRLKGDDDEEPELAEYAHGVPQVLWLLNSGVLESPAGRPDRPSARGKNPGAAGVAGPCPTVLAAARLGSPGKAVEHLYLSALSRPPTAAETARLEVFVAREKDPATGYARAYWAVLNSSEFLFNH